MTPLLGCRVKPWPHNGHFKVQSLARIEFMFWPRNMIPFSGHFSLFFSTIERSLGAELDVFARHSPSRLFHFCIVAAQISLLVLSV